MGLDSFRAQGHATSCKRNHVTKCILRPHTCSRTTEKYVRYHRVMFFIVFFIIFDEIFRNTPFALFLYIAETKPFMKAGVHSLFLQVMLLLIIKTFVFFRRYLRLVKRFYKQSTCPLRRLENSSTAYISLDSLSTLPLFFFIFSGLQVAYIFPLRFKLAQANHSTSH